MLTHILIKFIRYEGNYKDGLKNGYGKMVFPSGDVYEGMWVDNKMHGEGNLRNFFTIA